MGTIINQDGFRIVIYSNDHDPPHVHAFKSGYEAKIAIGDNETLPFIIEDTRMKSTDVRKALEIVKTYQDLLLRKWRELHG